MISECIANNFTCSNYTFTNQEQKLDIMKLRRLLNQFGLSPATHATLYIVEALQFLFDNNITEFNKLEDIYIISSYIHNVEIRKVQWVVESAIYNKINNYGDKDILRKVFYWYDSYEHITPRLFFQTMLVYLYNNSNEYKNS